MAAALAASVPGQAAERSHALSVQNNSTDGNGIPAYHRNADGTLTDRTTYPTGGLGGRASGSASDPLASQGSPVLVDRDEVLLAVDAGSDTVPVFAVAGDRLALKQVLPAGGQFPVGIAAHDNLVYVLNGGGAGSVSGFRVTADRLRPIEGSTRTLALGNANPPFFLKSPAEGGFSPDGDHLIVTTKTLNTVDVFSVGEDERLSATPTRQPSGRRAVCLRVRPRGPAGSELRGEQLAADICRQ